MKKFLASAVFVCCITVAVPAYAQEEHSAEKSEHAKEESWGQVAFKWVNLLVLFGAVGFLLKKPAAAFFDDRKREITSGLERAKTAQEESSRRMKEIEQRMSRLSSEIAALKAQADAESKKERDSILAETRRDMERMVEQSREEIDRIARGIERGIKEKIADAVIERAGHSLATQMTEDDQKRVVVRFLEKV